MKVTVDMIPAIEKALDIKLHQHQVNYILGMGSLDPERKSGKTLAYVIKLALSDGDRLPLHQPETFADTPRIVAYRGGEKSYANGFFLKMFLDVRHKLHKAGFKVRKLDNMSYKKHSLY